MVVNETGRTWCAGLGFCMGGRQIIETPLHAATTIAGMGTLSGTVKAPKEFKAAKVYARNLDKNVTYMVFTQNGTYRAINLLPGAYEVSVVKNGFAGDAQKITIKAGANASADFSLQEGPSRAAQGMRPDQPPRVPLLSYDALYPAGEGRGWWKEPASAATAPGISLPSKRWNAGQWTAAINLMESTTDPRPGRMSPTSVPQGISPHERETLVTYLVKNFGPDSQLRGLAVPDACPVDEEAARQGHVHRVSSATARQQHRAAPLP